MTVTFRFNGGTTRTEAHPEGTRVARPASKGGCWAVVSMLHNTKLTAPRSCAAGARNKQLCCPSHRAREAEARELKAQLDKAIATAATTAGGK